MWLHGPKLFKLLSLISNRRKNLHLSPRKIYENKRFCLCYISAYHIIINIDLTVQVTKEGEAKTNTERFGSDGCICDRTLGVPCS